MADVAKQAKVVALKENGSIAATDTTGTVVKVPTMLLTILLGEGTAGEQRATFMVLESDYVALGSPTYGAPITVTLSNP